jgi:hypothetical protein
MNKYIVHVQHGHGSKPGDLIAQALAKCADALPIIADDPKGDWIGIVVPVDERCRPALEAMPGVTVLGHTGHGHRKVKDGHVPLVAYAGVSAGDSLTDVADKLRAHHGHMGFIFEPEVDRL